MKAEIHTKRYVACPREGCDGKFWVEHLLSDLEERRAGRKFGPWYCDADHCDVVMDGEITIDSIDVTFSKREHKRGLALLLFGDSFLVYKEHRLHDKNDIETYDYFFHSHQCPINLIRHSIDVFMDGETGGRDIHDVHGQIRYVASVEDTPKVREQLAAVYTRDELFALFGTDGAMPPTMWPKDNKGLIPWLAQLRKVGLKGEIE